MRLYFSSRRPAGPARSDAELVAACLEGSAEAWEALVEKYASLVWSAPRRYRLPEEDAADIFQAVFADLIQELPRLRNPDALPGWLARVAVHKCYQRKMRAGREETAASDGLDRLAAPLQTPDAQIEILQREQRIREAVSRLPERCRQLVRMLFYEDPPLPYAEVAKRLGLAVGSIGLTRSRCLKKLEAGLVEAGL
jgi:RNA polymerase sigma factor (sigma-70 family)